MTFRFLQAALGNLVGFYLLGSAVLAATGWLLLANEQSASVVALTLCVLAMAVALVREVAVLRHVGTVPETPAGATNAMPRVVVGEWHGGWTWGLVITAVVALAVAFLVPFQVSAPGSVPSSDGLNLIEIFAQMGSVARGVAIVLFTMSLWSVGIAIERIYTYNAARKQSQMYAPRVAEYLRHGQLKEAIALSKSKEYRYSHLAKVVLAGLQEYQFQQEKGSNLNRDEVLDAVRRSIQRATALTSNDLKWGVNTLATIGSSAPFIGLLATIVGVINAFVGIGSTGSGGIAAVSAGIAEALVGTAFGLVVSIPAVWFYNYLTSRLEYFNVEMNRSSREFVEYVTKRAAY